jgi:hypothetical protein
MQSMPFCSPSGKTISMIMASGVLILTASSSASGQENT